MRKVIAIGKIDAFYDEKERFIGREMFNPDELISLDNGWYQGTVRFTDNGKSRFFIKVKLSKK